MKKHDKHNFLSPNSVVCPHLRRFVSSLIGYSVVVSKGIYSGKAKADRWKNKNDVLQPTSFSFWYYPSLEKNNYFAKIKTEPGQDNRLSLKIADLTAFSLKAFYFLGLLSAPPINDTIVVSLKTCYP